MRTPTRAASVTVSAKPTGRRPAGLGRTRSDPRGSGPATGAGAAAARSGLSHDDRPGSPPTMVQGVAIELLPFDGGVYAHRLLSRLGTTMSSLPSRLRSAATVPPAL